MKELALFLCLGFIVALLSCTKDSVSLPSDSGREVELTVRADAGQTKATEAYFDEELKSLQVFVFSDGILEAAVYSSSDSVTLRCFEGYKNIYAVVNHPEIECPPKMTDDDLLETVVELKDNLNVMFGYAINRYLPLVGTQVGTSYRMMMSVRRVAARIVLRSVKNSTSETVTVTRAYITNVAGDATFYAVRSSSDYEREPQVWYNKMGNTGDLEDMLCSEEMKVSVWGKGVEEKINEYFYCYPNPTEEDYKRGVWCPRFTRLVVEAEYGGFPWYYVIPLGGVQEDYRFIQSNHSYEVSLEITGEGAVDAEGFLDKWVDEDVEISPVSTKSGDGTAVVSFTGGCAEVREL